MTSLFLKNLKAGTWEADTLSTEALTVTGDAGVVGAATVAGLFTFDGATGNQLTLESLFTDNSDGTVAAQAVTTTRRSGRITDAAVLNAGASSVITWTNVHLNANSAVILTVEGICGVAGGLVAGIDSLAAGTADIVITNTSGTNSDAAPIVHYLIVGPSA